MKKKVVKKSKRAIKKPQAPKQEVFSVRESYAWHVLTKLVDKLNPQVWEQPESDLLAARAFGIADAFIAASKKPAPPIPETFVAPNEDE